MSRSAKSERQKFWVKSCLSKTGEGDVCDLIGEVSERQKFWVKIRFTYNRNFDLLLASLIFLVFMLCSYMVGLMFLLGVVTDFPLIHILIPFITGKHYTFHMKERTKAYSLH